MTFSMILYQRLILIPSALSTLTPLTRLSVTISIMEYWPKAIKNHCFPL